MLDFACLMFTGVPLGIPISNHLLTVAAEMLESGDAARASAEFFCEGQVQTDFKMRVLGGMAGVEFTAVVESDRGTTRAVFLVNPRVVEGLDDVTWIPAYRQAAGRNAHLN